MLYTRSMDRSLRLPPWRSPGVSASLSLSVCFVLGFSRVFVALGATATAMSRLLLQYRYEANLAGGAIVILFGVFMTGLISMPWLQRDLRFHQTLRGGRPIGAYVLGLAFAFGWTRRRQNRMKPESAPAYIPREPRKPPPFTTVPRPLN